VSDDLARFLLGTQTGAPLTVFRAYMTAWDAVTYANTVSVGTGSVWTNLGVINPSLLAVGPVLCLATPAAPVVLGRLYRAT
jgi:hypothetical protein